MAAKRTKSAGRKPSTKAALPGFAGLSAKQLATLTNKLSRSSEPEARDALLDSAGVSAAERPGLWWHLFEHGSVDVQKNPTLLGPLAEHAEHARPELLVRVVGALPPKLPPRYCTALVLPDWTEAMDTLACWASASAPEALDALGERPANVELGLAFVRGRAGCRCERTSARPSGRRWPRP